MALNSSVEQRRGASRWPYLLAAGMICLGCGHGPPPSVAGPPVIQPVSAAAVQEKEALGADFPQLDANADWPWWRGPSRNGVAVQDVAVPTHFSEKENVIWKTS